MSLDLRPLSLGELFDRAFTLYRRNLWLFVGITAVPSVFALMLTLLLQTLQRVTLDNAVTPDQQPSAEMIAAAVWLLAGLIAVAFLYWIVYMVALGATTFAVSELYVGRVTSVGEAYGRMRGQILRLVVLLLIVALRLFLVALAATLIMAIAGIAMALIHPALSVLAIMGGIALVFLGCLFMALRYALAVPALVLEGVSPRQAVKRSIELARGRLGAVFLMILCSTMVTYASLALFQGPFTVAAIMVGPDTTRGFLLNLLGAVTGSVGATFTTPFLIIGLALIYYDARIRQEGLDLELTLAALDGRTGMAGV